MSAYCARADIEQIFGTSNVEKWADLDDDADATKITARITAMIAEASEDIDDQLRGGRYELPFPSGTMTITTLAARLAGVLLYEARGVRDFESETGTPYHRLQWHRNRVEQVIKEIQSGQRILNAQRTEQSDVPFLVKDE